MTKGIKLMRIGGINIEIDYSWFFIAALITFSIATSPVLQAAELGGGRTFLTALIVALVFFASLLLHELAHSMVARARGIEVESIRLFFLGGVSNIKREPRSAFEEFLIAIVGPLTSAVLGALFLGARALVGRDAGVAYWALGYLGIVNIALAIFNMIPAFPLDGGRVFRSIVWGITRNPVSSTRIASYLSQGISALFIAGGVWFFLLGDMFNGLLFILLGTYLWSAARQSYEQMVAGEYLKGVQVGQVMSRPPEVLMPNATIGQAAYDFFARGYHVVAVVENGFLVGLLSDRDVYKIPQQDWFSTRVVEAMQRRQTLSVANETDPVDAAMKLMAEKGQTAIPVLNSEGYFVGLLTPADIARYLQMRKQFGQNWPQAGQPYPQIYQQPGYYNQGAGYYYSQARAGTPYNPTNPRNPYGGQQGNAA